MSHAPTAAAIHAEILQIRQAAAIQHHHGAQPDAVPPTNNATGGGRNLGPQANPGGFKSVQNAYSSTDIFSNYIGGPIGLTAFVDGLYADVLHRFPTDKETAFWTGNLESGRFTPYTVVSYFLISNEGVANGTGGRPLHPTVPPPNVYTAYLGGDVGVTAFVDGLYYDVLQRFVDPQGEAYWVDQIEHHQLLPADVTFTFLASSEYKSDAANFVSPTGNATTP